MLPLNDITRYKITVSVCVGCCRLSRTQSSRSTGSGESIVRQGAETPEKQTVVKKEKKILCSFFLCVCVRWKQDGDVACSLLCIPSSKQRRIFLYRYVCLYPTFTLWSPWIWRLVVWLVDMKVTEKHGLMSPSPGSSFSFWIWRHCLAPTTLVSTYQTTRFHNLENLMSCTLNTQSWWLNFALVSYT